MRILITGTAGRVGRHIYVHLMRDHQVTGIDITPCSTADFIGDIRDKDFILSLPGNYDAIIHTAALHAPHIGIRSDDEFQKINIEAAESLAEYAVESGVKHFIFTSTTALYGRASTPEGVTGWVTEKTVPAPKTIYHTSKIEAENRLKRISEQSGLPVTVLQMSRCFPEPADMMAIFRLNRGIDARDVALAHACALNKRPSGFNRYIISAATPFQPEDCNKLYLNAADIIRKRAPELANAFNIRGWKLPEKLDRVYDSSLAQKELNWQPRYGFQQVMDFLDMGVAEVLPPESRKTNGHP